MFQYYVLVCLYIIFYPVGCTAASQHGERVEKICKCKHDPQGPFLRDRQGSVSAANIAHAGQQAVGAAAGFDLFQRHNRSIQVLCCVCLFAAVACRGPIITGNC